MKKPGKLELNWRQKSLDSLEEVNTPPLDKEGDSYLVTTIHRLRSKPVGDFSVEDLRITIGQRSGLPFLVPLAIEVLENNILAEGDFYEGDLLKSVLSIDYSFWNEYRHYWRIVRNVIIENQPELQNFETGAAIKNSWFEKFRTLEQRLM